MRLALLLCLAACGRIGFDGSSSVVDGDGGRSESADATVPTGPVGPRWIKRFGTAGTPSVTGIRGEIAAVATFTNQFAADDGVAQIGQGFISTAFVRYSATGEVLQSATLDATGFCDMRGITMDGDDAIAVGFTSGTSTVPTGGACTMVTNRQDPVVIRIAPDDTQTLVAHWTASTANGQGWSIVRLTDGTFVVSGIYGGGLSVGSPLPTAMIDPSAWLARTAAGSPTAAMWGLGLVGADEIHGGPLATAGDFTCALGAYKATPTILGTALGNAGGYDAWVARIDGSGTASWVRSVGSTAAETQFGNGSIAARADGTCTIGISVPADITLDAVAYPVAGGRGLVVRYRSDGSVAWALRLPGDPFVAHVGDRLFAAFTLSGTLDVAGTPVTSQGSDTIVVEIDDTGSLVRVVGVIGGAGAQTASELVAIAPDALAVTIATTGELSFGATTFDTATTATRAIATLGI